jgi:hypothetical protein
VRRRVAAIGLYIVRGFVGADVIPDLIAEQLAPMLSARKARQSIVPPEWHRYAAVVYRGRFYRLSRSPALHPVVPFGRIEAFWAYLHRKLREKGGIRRERLDFYVAEYVWRYNRRHSSPTEQVRELLKLIRLRPGGRDGTLARAQKPLGH